MDLMQHVDVCTHKQCHTLNLVTTSRFDSIILQPLTIGPFFSNHAVFLFFFELG